MEARPSRSARAPRAWKIATAVAAIVVVAALAVSVTGFVRAYNEVEVVIDGVPSHTRTLAEDVAGLLDSLGVEPGERDIVTPAPSTALEDGMTIVVRRAVPVTVSVDGEQLGLDVIGSTVTDALVTAGIDPSAGVVVDPPLETELSAGMVITLPDSFVRVVEEEVEVPFEVISRNDASRPRGTRAVVTEGEEGRALRVYRTLVTGGVEGPRTLIAEEIVSEPVAEVVAVGTARERLIVAARAERPAASPAPAEGRTLQVTATGYAPGVGGVGTRTATGVRAGRGVIAVDPSVIPLGTKLYVPGYGYGVAADTGGAIKGAKIDLCFDSGGEARQWGRRTVTVTIVP